MFEGTIPVPFEKFGGLVSCVPPTVLDADLASEALNVAFTPFAVGTRPGMTTAFRVPVRPSAAISGLHGYVNTITLKQQPMVFDFLGNLYQESPAGSGTLVKITSTQVTPPASAWMNADSVYNRAYMAFGDMKQGTGAPATWDGTNLDPLVIADPLATLLPPPNNVVIAFDTNAGTVANATYYAVVTCIDSTGNESLRSAEVSVTTTQVGGKAELTLTWTAANGATSYRVYLGTGAGAENSYYAATAASLTIATIGGTGGSPPAAGLTVADSPTVGNVCAGVRYGIVLYKMRSGSYSLASKAFGYNAAGSKMVRVANVPVGPANVTQRVFAFGLAGGSTAGPFFIVPNNVSVSGVNEVATVIADNVTTTLDFNFDDTYLASATTATNYLRTVALPNQAGVAFYPVARRVGWFGDAAYPSMVRISAADDAAAYYGDTGFAQVSENDGQRVTATFEFERQIYVGKENGVYVVTPNDGDPSTWTVQDISRTIGIAGPRAWAAGDGFAIIVHRAGVYRMTGTSISEQDLISDEIARAENDIPGWWERINWSLGHLIWAHVDAERKEVRIGVPLDASATVSHVFKVNYQDGWERSFYFSPFTGSYHFHPGRKWSVDTVAASQAVTITRPITYAAGVMVPDQRIKTRQVLFGSSSADGVVAYSDPSSQTDNGAAIAASYATGYLIPDTQERQPDSGVFLTRGFEMNLRGFGKVQIEARAWDKLQKVATVNMDGLPSGRVTVPCLVSGDSIGFRISNEPGTIAQWHLRGGNAKMQKLYEVRV